MTGNFMRKTVFNKIKGKSVEMNGIPNSIEVFDKKAINADYVEICTFSGNHFSKIVLSRNGKGVWQSPLWLTANGYACYELRAMIKNYKLEVVNFTEKEGEAIIERLIPSLLDEAEKVIFWCNENNDENGRYWLSAYQGVGVYRLVVANKRIKGAIYGGFHECNCGIKSALAGYLVLKAAIYKVIEQHLGTRDFQLLKADGSGTHFYLRNNEDAVFLDTKEYDVPSASEILHHNIEVE